VDKEHSKQKNTRRQNRASALLKTLYVGKTALATASSQRLPTQGEKSIFAFVKNTAPNLQKAYTNVNKIFLNK
jgi:hypothetical protein